MRRKAARITLQGFSLPIFRVLNQNAAMLYLYDLYQRSYSCDLRSSATHWQGTQCLMCLRGDDFCIFSSCSMKRIFSSVSSFQSLFWQRLKNKLHNPRGANSWRSSLCLRKNRSCSFRLRFLPSLSRPRLCTSASSSSSIILSYARMAWRMTSVWLPA